MTIVSPDRQLPPWARVTGRVLRASMYALGVVVGIGDLVATSPVIRDSVGLPALQVWGWLAILSGLVGCVAVLTWRWRWEYVATCALSLALAARAVAVWATVDDVVARIAPAAGMTIAALACVLRGLDLTIFAIRTTSAAVLRTRSAG
ncbi:MAG: hypothetical protein NVV66_00150 [Cellulomonas sp.]|uniref:hypothetical protein n=1 Tax=Cellulomonas sp. TaxID=40001 RepID=UPI00258EDDB9|nr:hypothetical protein [Cellulomonas sp.]MCR6703165.1 hypothetical protein [Cellulomonas sp.]